ncbi:MFS transporter [Streptomyces mirabilis]|uniref:MFS transporter n=1 Tax=Streptomyces mirabilis TaxID=68239 RepID=UPI001E3CA9D1|nr:MFS transporter [Streptomyces mirabilis]
MSGLGNSITVVALPLIAVEVLDADSTAVGLLAAAVCFNTAYHSYIPIVLDGRNLLEGNAKLQGSEAAVQVAGPGAAGLLAQAFGAVAGLLADAVTFLISVVCLKRMRGVEPEHAPGEERPPLRRQIVEGLRFVGRDPYLRPMVTWGAVINMALMGYQAVQVVYLVRTVGLNPAMVGLLLTSGSAGGIVGALLANGFSRRFGTARGLLLLQGATAPFALLMPMTTAGPELLLFATGGFFVGIGISVANIVVGSFRQTYCPWAQARRMCVHPCRPADRRPRRRRPDAESYEPFAPYEPLEPFAPYERLEPFELSEGDGLRSWFYGIVTNVLRNTRRAAR